MNGENEEGRIGGGREVGRRVEGRESESYGGREFGLEGGWEDK